MEDRCFPLQPPTTAAPSAPCPLHFAVSDSTSPSAHSLAFLHPVSSPSLGFRLGFFVGVFLLSQHLPLVPLHPSCHFSAPPNPPPTTYLPRKYFTLLSCLSCRCPLSPGSPSRALRAWRQGKPRPCKTFFLCGDPVLRTGPPNLLNQRLRRDPTRPRARCRRGGGWPRKGANEPKVRKQMRGEEAGPHRRVHPSPRPHSLSGLRPPP